MIPIVSGAIFGMHARGGTYGLIATAVPAFSVCRSEVTPEAALGQLFWRMDEARQSGEWGRGGGDSHRYLATGALVRAYSILEGLHHEYALATARAGRLIGRAKRIVADHRGARNRLDLPDVG